jgi:hypothetical protein
MQIQFCGLQAVDEAPTIVKPSWLELGDKLGITPCICLSQARDPNVLFTPVTPPFRSGSGCPCEYSSTPSDSLIALLNRVILYD